MSDMNDIVTQVSEVWWHNGHLNENQRDFLIEILQKKKPKYCIETGFATGRSSVTTLIAAQPKTLVSIDINLDYMGARSHAEYLMNRFNNFHLIEGDSANVLSDNFFEKYFKDGIDFAFIDGSHTYAGALHDMNKIFAHMNKNGVMIIDDYMSGPPDGCTIYDVDRAVNDFSNSKSKVIERWHCNGKGFAIIEV